MAHYGMSVCGINKLMQKTKGKTESFSLQGKTSRPFLRAQHPLRGVCRRDGRLQRDLLGKPKELPRMPWKPLFQRDRGNGRTCRWNVMIFWPWGAGQCPCKSFSPHILMFFYRGDGSCWGREFCGWQGQGKDHHQGHGKDGFFISAFLPLYENPARL